MPNASGGDNPVSEEGDAPTVLGVADGHVTNANLTWDEWLWACSRFVRLLDFARRWEATPTENAALFEQLARDRQLILDYLINNPELHRMLLLMLSASGILRNRGEDGWAASSGSATTQSVATGTGTSSSSSGGSTWSSRGMRYSHHHSYDDEVFINNGTEHHGGTSSSSCAPGGPSSNSNDSGGERRQQDFSEDSESGTSGVTSGSDTKSATYLLETGRAWRGAVMTEPVTTLWVLRVPHNYSQQDLLKEWPPDGTYNFLHLRGSCSRLRQKNIVVINFTDPLAASTFIEQWHGRKIQANSKPLAVIPAEVQGREANLQLVLDCAPVAPVIVEGVVVLSPKEAMDRVRLAKRSIFVFNV